MARNYSNEVLGRVIRQRRESYHDRSVSSGAPGLSQQKLGELAGYAAGAGAGVSISRIESGDAHPTPARLAGIALAFGVTPEQLVAEAVDLELAQDRERLVASVESAGGCRCRSPHPMSTSSWLEDVQREIGARQARISEATEKYNASDVVADRAFLVPLTRLASRIEGAPTALPDSGFEDDPTLHPVGTARDQVREKIANRANEYAAGVAGGVAAIAVSGLLGSALGGGAASVGIPALAAAVTAPIAPLALGGYLWARSRSKRQDDEIRRMLCAAQGQLDQSQLGIAMTVELMKPATELLEMIGVHGGRAVDKLVRGLPEGTLRWDDDLDDGQQHMYLSLIGVAGAQLTLYLIDYLRLMGARDGGLDELYAVYGTLLTEVAAVIDAAI